MTPEQMLIATCLAYPDAVTLTRGLADPEDFIDSVRAALSYQDSLYAVPFYGESSFLVWNKDLFEAKGLEMPEKPTWEQIGEFAAELAGQAGLSSAHITFCTEAERNLGEQLGWLGRTSTQFHWEDRGWADYDDFLGALSSRKRKALRKERARANEFGGRIRALRGDEIAPRHWDAMWAFYQDTGGRKWGRPYLTRAFFEALHETMRDDCLLVIAERDGRPVAGALNLIGADTLYGRYWGCIEDHPFLHFEVCYHQAIDFAIDRKLKVVEAGAQGEHKLARGYVPVPTWSAHYIPDASFRRAVADFLVRERAAVAQEQEFLGEMTPFRRG